MEKRAIVEVGRTPSEMSGEKSTMIKNGVALSKGESCRMKADEDELAKNMKSLYNRHGST